MFYKICLVFLFSFIVLADEGLNIKIPRGAEMEKIIDQLAAQGMFSKAQAEEAKKEMKKMDDGKWKKLENQANQQVQKLMKSGAMEEMMKNPDKMQEHMKNLDKDMLEKFQKQVQKVKESQKGPPVK